MRLVDRLVAKLQSWRLRYRIATGQQVWGRQDTVATPKDGSGTIGATMKARVTMGLKVIRADGTVEDLGIVKDEQVAMTKDQFDALRRAAQPASPFGARVT